MHRRAREARHQMWRAAPVAAGVVVCTAALSRWAGWPLVVPASVLLLGALMLWVFRYVNSRKAPVSDRAAAAIDADAGMGGELRSAGWFAARDTSDPWTVLHLSRASARMASLNWPALYPPLPEGRSKLATAGLLVAAAIVAFTLPERAAARAQTMAAAGAKSTAAAQAGPSAVVSLDPELQKALEALLAMAADGTLPTVDAIENDAQLRNALAKMAALTDAQLLAALKRALAANPDARTRAAAESIQNLADAAKRAAAEGTLSQETLDALEKLADDVEFAQAEESTNADASEAAGGGAQKGDAGDSDAAAGSDEVSIQFAKSADPGGGAGMLMMSGQNAQPGGPPGAGVGGSGSQDAAASAGSIDAALKHEVLEASQDTPDTDKDSEIRRRTEHGNATVQFTRGEAAQFDRTRAAAPPPIPEARRQGVQTYFVRRPAQ